MGIPPERPTTRRPGGSRGGYYRGESYRIEESVGYLMKVIHESLSREVDARMEEHSLTDAQWRPLFLLSQEGVTTAAQIARNVRCDAGALTRMIDRLEEKGLVRRSRNSEDRRVQNLELTEDGRRAVAVVPHVLASVLNEHLAGLSHAEIDQLKTLLQRVAANSRSRFSERARSGEPE